MSLYVGVYSVQVVAGADVDVFHLVADTSKEFVSTPELEAAMTFAALLAVRQDVKSVRAFRYERPQGQPILAAKDNIKNGQGETLGVSIKVI